ncbi:MAG TPA: hypothetical protein VN905_05865 [Candidatus Binatia bacterium]|nr:hypothetical protein [Candidatus Binatia bacterium]
MHRVLIGLAIVAVIGAGVALILLRHRAAPVAVQPTPCDVMRDAGPNPAMSLRDACRNFAIATVANLKNDTNAGAERASLRAADDYRSLFKIDVALSDRDLANKDHGNAEHLYAIALISLNDSVSQGAAAGLRDLEDSYKAARMAHQL